VGFELFVALRYLLAPRKQAFISVISSISTIGVAVGVMAVIVALALMTGLQGELRDRILGSMGHVYVWKTGGIEDYRTEIAKLTGVRGVVAAAPAVLPWAVGFAVGALIYLVLAELLPESYRQAGRTSIALATILAMGIVVLLDTLRA